MKKILTIVLIGFALTAKSQSASVEKSVFGIQTGLLGLWAHNEARITDQLALRSEIGVNAGLVGSTLFINPIISVEPRWYYNLNKRMSASKRTSGNSGNFFSLKISYHHDEYQVTNDLDFLLLNSSYKWRDISIVPSWGIRRYLGNHFNYEAGIGYGYYNVLNGRGRFDGNIHVRIGYKF